MTTTKNFAEVIRAKLAANPALAAAVDIESELVELQGEAARLVAEEREACARIADNLQASPGRSLLKVVSDDAVQAGEAIARAIRARA